jgi:hypothetical protein
LTRLFGAALALVLMASVPGHAAEAPDAVAKTILRQALGAISQADGTTARRLIGSIRLDDLPVDQRTLAGCISVLLDMPVAYSRSDGTVAGNASDLYRQYWLDAAMGRAPVDLAEEDLRRKLAEVLRLPAETDWDSVAAELETTIKKQGYGVLLGRTGRLRELMVWTSAKTEKRDVTLPEGAFNVSVTYLNTFESMGWTRYLSCDRIGTGGWAKPEGLYAVVPAYPSLDDELFRLSFLGHETQHFSDYSRFPGLKPWELEYRAKLVELHYAERISPVLLRGFASATGHDPQDSHAYANGRVIAELKARLKTDDLSALPVADIQRAALDALLADSKERQAK